MREDDHVYLSLAEGQDDARWAFGTGFEDPLHGVDTEVPDGVDPAELAALCVGLGDDALVASQRLAEWCTLAPELEEEVALANIGLDLLGQARMLLTRAGQVDGTGRTEDDLAYLREPEHYRNVRLVELPNGDFAFSMARLLVFSAHRLAVFGRLAAAHADPVLRAVAAKGVKELAYHRQYAADWVVRLGDGTDESHRRMREGLEAVAPYVDELFRASGELDREGGGGSVRDEVVGVLAQVAEAATLTVPEFEPMDGDGRAGVHTPCLAPLLFEMQSVARALPGGRW
ncbi:phenylacetate-CoA oxygenase subunit PaaI [Actinomadura logoneensis]|uniref:Phenylacetate-CoA oxygenase subunit PaaI n=1 Tax=Actinomadura logoneensis TaxID=2293572 RepID=A0A372JD31_9ACTN|nr:1,2-phenylacetyl-CoA epoxidase subunit PaaC [Actinomadura logoneensis]RFU37892.1 phenylacetate-CoA oxygenase subunit PaaI [Actinomadura logoneensis]